MITQDDAEKAVDWLRTNARSMAQARAERLYLEQWLKSLKAQLMEKAEAKTVAERESKALCNPSYFAALEAYKQAVTMDETNRFLLAAAEAKIDAWRSQESTRRAEGRALS